LFGRGDVIVGLFLIVPVFIGAVFVVVIGFIIFMVVKGITEWADNNNKPILSERARIVAKRLNTRGSVQPNMVGGVSTSYYATFEVPLGDRIEFRIGGKEYGMLAEGDAGTLVYQGTRYHGFERGRV
jgi:hypothetical protein